MELETINKLYLELSQITTATTAREILLQKQLAEAQREAVSLARSLFKRHYAQEPHYASGEIEWEPCDTPAGVITQIDNMVAGVCAQLAEAQKGAERWNRAEQCARLDQFGGFVVTPDEPAFASDVSLAFTREIDAAIDAAKGEPPCR